MPGGAPPCQGIIIGAGDKSYLHQGTQFAVLANEAAAVEYTGGCPVLLAMAAQKASALGLHADAQRILTVLDNLVTPAHLLLTMSYF